MNPEKADFFDSEAESEWSSKEYDSTELKKIERILDSAAIKPGSRVIEPGCGTGRLTEIISGVVGPAGQIVATEISDKMLDKARLRVGALTNIKLLRGAVEELNFTPQGFDCVICHNVFPHFDDKRFVVSKLVEALRMNGLFVVSHLMSSSWVNDLHRKTNPAVSNDFLPGEDEMREMFENCGMLTRFISDDERGYLLEALRI